MRRKHYPLNVMRRANVILAAWDRIGTTVLLGNFTQRVFNNDITRVKDIEAQICEAEMRLRALRNERDAAYGSLWNKVKRVYDTVKGMYGDDSIEYQLVGRTRTSKQKRRSRK
jgi:hypothetical protein